MCGCLIGQFLETHKLSQDGRGSFGSGSLADVVSGEMSMTPDSAAGVMSARAFRADVRVSMPVVAFAVCVIDVWGLRDFDVLELSAGGRTAVRKRNDSDSEPRDHRP